jgi:hypothetical protein
MRRTLIRIAAFAALLLGLSAAAFADGPTIDSGYRQVNEPPEFDERAVVFWQFEQDLAQEAANAGKLQGNAAIIDGGRFGKALRLAGGGDAVVLGQIVNLRGNERTIDFWLRFDRAPSQVQTVLAIANREGKSILQLDLLPEGRLELQVEDIQPTRTEPIPPGQWLHVALNDYFDPYPTQHPNVLSLRIAGVRLSVNGIEAATAAAPGGGPYHKGRRNGLPEARQLHRLVLGNNLAFNRGFVGLIDAFRFSNGARYFYRPASQAWLQPDQSLPLEREPQFFQDPAAQIFSETFDNSQANDVRSVPGVRGGAVIVEDPNGLRIDLPANLDLTGGTIEFWVRPENWDNLFKARNENDANRYAQRRINLVTLFGAPVNGKGDAQPLIRVQADRARVPKYPAPYDLTPNQWVHVAVIWGPNVEYYQPSVFIDGHNIPWDIRSRSASKARDDVWQKHRPSYLVLGGDMKTAFDELRVHRIALREQEVQNGIAQARGDKLKKLWPGVVRFDYRYSIGELDVVLDLMSGNETKVTSASVGCELPKKQTITRTIDKFEGGYGRISGRTTLNVGQLPEGDYRCVVIPIINSDGGKLAPIESFFTRSHLSWLDTQVGKLDTPPRPFTSVDSTGRTVRVVGREQIVGGTGLFESINVLGEPILAAPVRIELTQAGSIQVFTGNGEPRFSEVNRMEANWQAAASAGDLRLHTKATMEYDGMTRFDLTFASTKAIAVERLAVVIPLKAKYGRYLHALPLGGDSRNYEVSVRLPDRRGVLWDSASGFSKRPIVRPTVGNFIPQIWLGDELRGLVWFADSDKGWVPSNEHPAITITRDGEQLLLTLNLISERFTLDAPRTIIFGSLPTPPKPLPDNYRIWNKGNNEQVGRIGGPLTSTDAFRPWIMAPRESAMHYWPWGYRWEHVEEAVKLERQRRPRDALMLYADKPWVSRGRDAEYFAWEWHAKGVRRTPAIYPPTQVDMLAWYWNEFVRGDIYDGVYIDDVFPTHNFNTVTGSAYELPDGRIQPGVSFFGFREYVKRLREILHANGKPSLITFHMTSALIMPACSFVDLAWDGEDVVRFRDKRNTFIDVWPIERFMNLSIPQRTGMITEYMFKGAYSTAADRDPARIHRLHRSVSAAQLLYDVSEVGRNLGSRGTGKSLVALIDSYTTPDVTFHGYWQNQDMMTVEAVLDHRLERDELPRNGGGRWRWSDQVLEELAVQPLRASVYRDRTRNRALIVVTNFARVPVRGKVTLKLDRLGVPSVSQQSLAVTDVDDWPTLDGDTRPAPGQTVPIRDGTIELAVDGHDFRLIEITWK